MCTTLERSPPPMYWCALCLARSMLRTNFSVVVQYMCCNALHAVILYGAACGKTHKYIEHRELNNVFDNGSLFRINDHWKLKQTHTYINHSLMPKPRWKHTKLVSVRHAVRFDWIELNWNENGNLCTQNDKWVFIDESKRHERVSCIFFMSFFW